MKQHVIFEQPNDSSFRFSWLGCLDYEAADTLQREIEAQRLQGEVSDTLLLLEHPHTYTLGRSASQKDILISSAQCLERSIKICSCDRGGQITYHGPGQLVGYMIFDLKARHLSVPEFVWHVEESMRIGLRRIGIDSERLEGRPGLWVNGSKLASLGFHISRGISRHGFSINVNPQLEYYDWIIPCGAKLPVSSIYQEMGKVIETQEILAVMLNAFDQVFSDSVEKGSLLTSPSANSSRVTSVSSS